MAVLCIPKETKAGEGRVALTPTEVRRINKSRHRVYVESGAGDASGFSDSDYWETGAYISSKEKIWRSSSVVVKVKELQEEEFARVKPYTILFCFVHGDGNKQQKDFFAHAAHKQIFAVPYEHMHENNEYPILKEMSTCAGKLAALIACQYMRCDNGGPGMLPEDMRVQIIGAGNAGKTAAYTLAQLGTHMIAIHDTRNMDPIPYATLMNSERSTLAEIMWQSNVVIACARSTGGAPKLITRAMAEDMKKGSLIIDIAIDEGGNCEFSRPTTPEKPLFRLQKKCGSVRIYALPNMPGMIPQSASPLLSRAVYPYIQKLLKSFSSRNDDFSEIIEDLKRSNMLVN